MVMFAVMCRAFKLPEPVAELVFARPRRWRFDYAWPEQRVALEVQGGLFTRGRHSRGPALMKEHEKLNTAAAMGWRVLYCTPAQLARGDILPALELALEHHSHGGRAISPAAFDTESKQRP
jgi:hypothetical protein